VELIQALRREVPRVRFVLAAGREDLWPAVRIHEETARHTPLLGPDLDAATLAAVLAHCRLVVGGDADLLQLAAASGAPTVALFGPSAPERRAPRGPGHRWIVAPRGDLRRLTAAAVAEACRQSLEVAGDPAAE
jgi:ADP-heptose:LPS heptosyltransferase